MNQKILNDCPFCGGLSALIINEKIYSSRYEIYGRCSVCGAEGKHFESDDENDDEKKTFATSAWNMRTNTGGNK